jgi:sarcosine oxidase subunit gamma
MPEAVDIRVLPAAARFILQGGHEARAAAGAAFCVPLPEEACRAGTGRGRAALWLGPDEHLLLAPAEEARAVEAALAAALAGIAHSLVEVSDRQVAIAIVGPGGSELLSSGCPLDLDLSEFPAGMCTRTVLGKADVVLWRRGDREYHLETGRSYSGYVLEWLREAG